jgi:hypothetical protein
MHRLSRSRTAATTPGWPASRPRMCVR